MEKRFSTVEDIIADESFQAWYFRQEEAAVKHWEATLAADPALLLLVKEATAYMEALAVREQSVPAGQLQRAEQRLMQNLEQTSPARVISIKRSKPRWWWAAAAVLLLSLGGFWLANQKAPPAPLQTSYGEISRQQLPDGSTVLLNANSEISFRQDFHEGKTREIWLKGEAFFQIAKTPSKARFIVHTDRFDVVVTGTQFNVMNRAGNTHVMLTEGSVTLQLKQGKEIHMKPGDFVEFAGMAPQVKTAREENVLAWREKKLFFEKTPLRIAVQQIEELYGVTIRLANEQLGEKPISGIMMNDNLDVLLQALEATTEFRIERKDKEILIKE